MFMKIIQCTLKVFYNRTRKKYDSNNHMPDITLRMRIFLNVYNINSRDQCLTWNLVYESSLKLCTHEIYIAIKWIFLSKQLRKEIKINESILKREWHVSLPYMNVYLYEHNGKKIFTKTQLCFVLYKLKLWLEKKTHPDRILTFVTTCILISLINLNCD